MNVATRGFRNAFRNTTRTISIVIILGLSIGLSLIMLIAHQAVDNKIKTALSAIGNTVTIQPAGYNAGSQANNALTTAQLAKVRSLAHVTNLTESLQDHLQTTGTTSSGKSLTAAQGTQDNSATTSLTSPEKVRTCTSGSCSGGGPVAVSGGGATALPSDFSLPISIVGSNHPTDPSSIGASSFKIVSGTAIDGSKDTNNAMIGTTMAAKNNLKVGSAFTAYGKTLTVAAIFDSDTSSGNASIIVSLAAEQRLANESGAVTNAVATADSLTNLSSVTAAIKKTLGSTADVTSNVAQANQTLAPLSSVKQVSLYSLIGAVAAGAIIILLTMIMIVRERRREIGIFKAIGFSNLRIMFQFMAEALTLTLLGAVIGLILGFFGGSPVTSSLVSNSGGSSTGSHFAPGSNAFTSASLNNIKDIHTQIGWAIILSGLGVAVLIALIGSALASYFIKCDPPKF